MVSSCFGIEGCHVLKNHRLIVYWLQTIFGRGWSVFLDVNLARCCFTFTFRWPLPMSWWRKWKNLRGRWFRIGWRTFSRAGRRQTTSKWPFSSSPLWKGEMPAWSVEMMFMNDNVEIPLKVGERVGGWVEGWGLKGLTKRLQIHPCSIGAVSNGWGRKGKLNSAQNTRFLGWKLIVSGEKRGTRASNDPGWGPWGGCWRATPGNQVFIKRLIARVWNPSISQKILSRDSFERCHLHLGWFWFSLEEKCETQGG